MNRLVKWDTRSGDIVQEYDCHLGLVNFVNGNRRFVTTSNDKSLCCESSQSPPYDKRLASQSLDNKVVIFSN
ncbi:hypothetical protein pipiens_013616 [Culex pipiens pipiens]|uniref:Uncharacterized protein n=1 Tax=Culex pipiens pipiens TaxID=38569 RepID=A0ABD1CXS7_CULPP